MFDTNKGRCAFVEFQNLCSAQGIYSYFQNEISSGKGMPSVFWGIDTWENSRENWVSVVLRNVPPDTRPETLMRNCTKMGEKVKYITMPQNVKG